MILLCDTSTPVCKITLVKGGVSEEYTWQADRQLAKGLLGFVQGLLSDRGQTWHDLEGIGVYQGPGSFTGLRIGLTVMNTTAEGLSIPIVGATGDDWQQHVLDRLKKGETDAIVLPYYGSDAHITKPRK